MNTATHHRDVVGRFVAVLWLLLALLHSREALAFPPAPHHLIYGLVRDELGHPLKVDQAEILFESASGVRMTSRVAMTAEGARNYELRIPIDSGITGDLYMPTAMRPTVPFKIRVRVGTTVYLPIEMSGDYSLLGQPGKKTRLNLTLGVDADGDGLPDAWERALIAAGGSPKSIADILPGADADGDGLTNVDEYVAGTYAFDKEDGYDLKIKASAGGAAILEFMAVRGRTYSIQSSRDLKQWTTEEFRVGTGDAAGAGVSAYYAPDVRVIQVQIDAAESAGPTRIFRLRIE